MKNDINSLQALLDKTGWTQTELAQALSVSFATINRWLHAHASPQPGHRRAIARLYREYIGLPPIADADTTHLLERAERCRIDHWPHCWNGNAALERELIVDTTYNSNAIEGTTLSLRETERLLYAHENPPHRPFLDQLLTANYAAILKDILNGNDILYPPSQASIQQLHQRLFQGVRDDAGRYSVYPRGIVGLNIQLPYPEDIPEEMARLVETRARGPQAKSAVVFMAETHAAFELIHPFGDGNGRIGRLLLAMQCLAFGYPPLIIEKVRKIEYYEVLEEAQRRSSAHLVRFIVEELERTATLIQKYRKG